jgi:hypothetical protein
MIAQCARTGVQCSAYTAHEASGFVLLGARSRLMTFQHQNLITTTTPTTTTTPHLPRNAGDELVGGAAVTIGVVASSVSTIT